MVVFKTPDNKSLWANTGASWDVYVAGYFILNLQSGDPCILMFAYMKENLHGENERAREDTLGLCFPSILFL